MEVETISSLESQIVYALILLPLIMYLYLKKKYKEDYMSHVEWNFILEIYKYRKHTLLSSVFFTVLISVIYIITSEIGGNKAYDPFESLIISISTFIGIYGLFMTLNVFYQQKEPVVNFDELLNDITSTFNQVIDNNINSKHKKVINIYIYNYHPLLGILSSEKEYQAFLDTVDRLKKSVDTNINIISYHEDSLDFS